LHLRLNPDAFQAQLIIWVNSIAEKAPENARQAWHFQSEVVEIFTEIVQDAVRRKELVLPDDMEPLSLVHGMWLC